MPNNPLHTFIQFKGSRQTYSIKDSCVSFGNEVSEGGAAIEHHAADIPSLVGKFQVFCAVFDTMETSLVPFPESNPTRS